MATLHTYNAALYLGGTNSVLITEGTEATFEIDFDVADDSAFGDTWETRAKGANRWTGSFSGNFDTASTNLFDIATSQTISKLYLYPDRGTTARYYYGNCWPKLSVNLTRTDVGKISGSLEGSGELADV